MSVKSIARSPIALLFLVLGCLALLCLVFSLVWQAHLPFDGVFLTELTKSGTSVAILVSPQSTGLEVGDQLLAIDGTTVEQFAEADLRGQQLAHFEIGQTVFYTVRRGAETLTIPVLLGRFPLARLLLLRPGVYLLMLASLFVGSYLLFARPQERSARLLFVTAISLNLPLVLHFQAAHLYTPVLFVVENVLKGLGMCLLLSGLLHIFLTFPVVKPGLRGREGWLLGLHAINPLASGLLAMFLGHTALERLLIAWEYLYWIGLAMLAWGIVSVVHTYITVPQATVRSQIRWIAWGSVIGITPYLLFTGIPEALSGKALLNIEVTAFFLVAVPISIAIAVARYRLFDIDTVIQRSLLYGLLTGLFTILYLGLVALLNALVLRSGTRTSSTTVVFISTLISATAFWALRERLLRWIGPIFYRARLDLNTFLAEMSDRLSQALLPANVTELLTGVIPSRLEALQGGLMVLSQDEKVLNAVPDADFQLPVDEVLAAWTGHTGQPIVFSAPGNWVPEVALRAMAQWQSELAIPLFAGEQLVGIWSLGEHRAGRPYSSAEINMLMTLARQAAIAVQNARLVRRMERQNQELEAVVQRRTQVLEEERNRLNAILESMGDGLLVTAADGAVQLANPALKEMVGKSARDLLARPVAQALAIPDLAEAINTALQEPGRAHFSNLAHEQRTFKASITALDDRSAVITLLHDTTRETEIDRIKSEFISTVSHELRTPLTSILGFTRLIHRTLQRTISPALPPDPVLQQAKERMEENLEVIAREGTRLTHLITDALDMAVLDSGEVVWNDQPTDLPLLLQQATTQMRESAWEKELFLRVNCQGKFQPLTVDPARIGQVVAHLLENAIKFSERGEVVVGARPLPAGQSVHSWTSPVGGGVLVSVQDQGCGIAAKEMDKIFSRFYQAGDNLHGKPQGTGLGLAICQEIVGHYGGTIWAESTLGAGSTFYFTLPLHAQPKKAG